MFRSESREPLSRPLAARLQPSFGRRSAREGQRHAAGHVVELRVSVSVFEGQVAVDEGLRDARPEGEPVERRPTTLGEYGFVVDDRRRKRK